MAFNLAKAKKMMREKGMDCIIASSRENVYYSSGADVGGLELRFTPVILPMDSDPVFVLHPNEEIKAGETSWIKDRRTYSGGEWVPMEVWKYVANVLKEKNLQQANIGLELFKMPSPCMDYLRETLPSAKFVDAQLVFNKMRSVKSAEELKLLSDANMATVKAVYVAYEMARPGDTEKEIARNMMNMILEYGADRVAGINLESGKNTLGLHHVPSDYKIKKGDLVHVDFGGFWKGYHSDIARMAVVGEPSEKQLKAYSVVVNGERDAAKAMTNGATVMEVFNATKRSYESNGAKFTRLFIGHSCGLGGHETPMIGPMHGDWVLEPGMVFQLEPRLNMPELGFGVHTEDSFITMEKGPAKNMSEYRDISELQVIK